MVIYRWNPNTACDLMCDVNSWPMDTRVSNDIGDPSQKVQALEVNSCIQVTFISAYTNVLGTISEYFDRYVIVYNFQNIFVFSQFR